MPIALDHATCSLSLEQEPTLQGRITIAGETKTITVTSDLNQLQNLVTVVERYLEFLLRNERQGVFSESAAIRPLDFVAQRLTLRQGEGIAQVDLNLTQLYDLAEVLQDLQDQVPDLAQRRLVVVRPWYKQPSGIAAIFVGAVSIAAAIAAIVTPGDSLQVAQTEANGRAVDALTGEVIEADPNTELEPIAAPVPPAASQATVATSESTAVDNAAADIATDTTDTDATAVDSSAARLAELPDIAPTWDVPAAIDQPLVYILGLNAAGDLIEVNANDDVAATYQDQLPLPALAVAPEDMAVVQRFRLEFEPDGTVTVLPLEE